MKNAIKRLLQSILGFDNYLIVFARYKVRALKFDKKERDFFTFLQIVPDQGVILDIGANLGIMTWHMVRHFKQAQIWAFEPIPDNLRVLRNMLNGTDENRYRIFETALGARKGHTKMVLPEIDKVRMQGLSHVLHDSIDDFNDGRHYKVEMDTLDNMIPEDQVISGIKLDVENFEYFVLLGGRALIERDHPVIYTELWDNENRYQCIQLLESIGYQTKVCAGKELIRYEKSKFTGQNFFFVFPG